MCYRILKVSYHADKATDLIEIETQEEYNKRFEEISNRPGVRKLTIFRPIATHEEVKRWEVTTHSEEDQSE